MLSTEIVTINLPNKDAITITPDVVKRYICESATEQEIMMFMNLCKSQQLNPFTRDAYLIKYGNMAASIVVGKDAFTKRAEKQLDYEGFKAGIIVQNNKGDLEEREGAFIKPEGEQIVGGWAEVFRKGKQPFKNCVSFAEYAVRKKDGSLNSQWSSKPATMIRKVALVHSLREAYPEALGGMYDEVEINNNEINQSIQPVKVENITPINNEQAINIRQALEYVDNPTEEQLCKAYKINSVEELPSNKYDSCIKRLEELRS